MSHRYTTTTTIYTTLPGLTENTTTADVIVKYAQGIAGKIDSYVVRRYSPVGWTSSTSIPGIIKYISDSLVRKSTMMSLFTRDAQNKNEWVLDLATDAKEDLEKIRKGDLPITLNGSEESIPPEVKANRQNNNTVFDMDDPLNQSIDSDLLDDINRDRD